MEFSTDFPVSSFTITQPFLGAPLQFLPALGSSELEELIDAYIEGPAVHQDKVSEVALDFFLHATVDLNTGALVKHYPVFPFPSASASPWTSSQSLMDSPSSSFGSFTYSQSPNSSASILADSSSSSISTPLIQSQRPRASTRTPPKAGRASKKAAKPDTQKTTETRLPGFSIMTKDGVDVTNSAGRCIKTKEQREHAHLMRIMKACDQCKKKKIRCDPSHRRSSRDGVGRSSASSTDEERLQNSLTSLYDETLPSRTSFSSTYDETMEPFFSDTYDELFQTSFYGSHGQLSRTSLSGTHDEVSQNSFVNRHSDMSRDFYSGTHDEVLRTDYSGTPDGLSRLARFGTRDELLQTESPGALDALSRLGRFGAHDEVLQNSPPGSPFDLLQTSPSTRNVASSDHVDPKRPIEHRPRGSGSLSSLLETALQWFRVRTVAIQPPRLWC